jgi:1,4-alpha-glucan branching enzyme
VHRSWRVTDRTLPPDAKQPYVPERAARQARDDARHFVDVVRATAEGRPGGLVVAAYDTELLGHWWHEGPMWLGHVLDLVADDPGLITTTLASRRARRPPTRRMTLPESSWGYAKGHASWVTPDTREVWTELRAATDRARRSLADGRGPTALRDQVARELALLSASDWPFMMTRGRSPEYARERVATHAGRVHRLCDAIDAAGSATDRSAAITGDPVPPDATLLLAALDRPPAGRS